jgi:hypothetical protein
MPRLLTYAFVLLAFLAGPAAADGFQRIGEREVFLDAVEGRELHYRLFGIRLQVLPDGRIDGTAMGWDVTGTWEWRDGFFCRELDWSGKLIPMNCQLVEARAGREVRFTVDRGAGDSASFRLR